MTMADWSRHDETLRTMHATGASHAAIAARIPNATRNAVIARARRLGLARAHLAPQVRKAAAAPKTDISLALASPLSAKLLAAFVPAPGQTPKPFDNLSARACRWPYDGPAETLFCGVEIAGDGRSYCAAHAALAHRPAGGVS